MAIQAGTVYVAKAGTTAAQEKDQGHNEWVAVERTGRGWRFRADDGCTSVWRAEDMEEKKVQPEDIKAGDMVKILPSAANVSVGGNPYGPVATSYVGRELRVERVDGRGAIVCDGWFFAPKNVEKVGPKVEETTDHQKDIDTIFEALHAEAEEREWCDEYTDFVNGLISRLTVKPTKGVKKDFELTVFGETYTVNAFSETEAQEKLTEILSGHVNYYSGKLESE